MRKIFPALGLGVAVALSAVPARASITAVADTCNDVEFTSSTGSCTISLSVDGTDYLEGYVPPFTSATINITASNGDTTSAFSYVITIPPSTTPIATGSFDVPGGIGYSPIESYPVTYEVALTLTEDIPDTYTANFSDSPAATPLPSTWLMLLSGFVCLGFFAYRGAKNNAATIAAA